MNPLNQARELNETLLELHKSPDPNIKNEAAQLLVVILNATTSMPPDTEDIEEVRERTEALLKGIKHHKRLDLWLES